MYVSQHFFFPFSGYISYQHLPPSPRCMPSLPHTLGSLLPLSALLFGVFFSLHMLSTRLSFFHDIFFFLSLSFVLQQYSLYMELLVCACRIQRYDDGMASHCLPRLLDAPQCVSTRVPVVLPLLYVNLYLSLISSECPHFFSKRECGFKTGDTSF